MSTIKSTELTTSPIKADGAKPSVWRELRDAGMHKIAGFAFLALAAYLIAVVIAIRFAGVEKAGQFGDSFGVLTAAFNALAFAAVVATVVLQSRELRESRTQLELQAVSQKAWAEAATRQIELTERLESAKATPFIQAVWIRSPTDTSTSDLMLTNVGLGIAIVHAIDVYAGGELLVRYDRLAAVDPDFWNSTVERAATVDGEAPLIVSARPAAFDDSNRVLGPGEQRLLLHVSLENDGRGAYYHYFNAIESRLHVVVHFQSIYREQFNTHTQFDFMHEMPVEVEPDNRGNPRASTPG